MKGFDNQWKHRGMVTSTGKPVTHGKLLLKLLQGILVLITLEVYKCSAHTNAKDIVSTGNTFADKTAKEAAEQTTDVFTLEEDKQPVTATFLKDMQMHNSKTFCAACLTQPQIRKAPLPFSHITHEIYRIEYV